MFFRCELVQEAMEAKTNIPHRKDPHGFNSTYKNVTLSVELLPCGGWLAGVYDLEGEGWLWTEYISDAEGKTLISRAQGVNSHQSLWCEYRPLSTREN